MIEHVLKNVIEYIYTNKEWIFSGVGVSVFMLMGSLILKNSRSRQSSEGVSASPVRVELVHTPPVLGKKIFPDSEVEGIVKRFNKVLELLNENRTYDRYTISGLAQIMSLKSVSELESIFLGESEPTFEFIKSFCDILGLDKKWLIEGKNTPFYSSDSIHYDPMGVFDFLVDSNPSRIYFIRSESEVGQVFILLKFEKWRYKIISQIWHISDHVGGGGQSQILGMYKLISALNKTRLYSSCGGRILPEKQFNSLFDGEVFPGSVIEFPSRENPWWDDFIDVYHKYPISANYEAWYGEGFMKAQSIVRWKLREENDRGCDHNSQ